MVDAIAYLLGFVPVDDFYDNVQWIVYCEKMCVTKICSEKNDKNHG